MSTLALFAYDHGPAWLRRLIIRRLARRDLALADPLIPIATHDRDVYVRLATLEVLATNRRLQDLETLYLALHDGHAAVRAAAAHALGRYRSARVGRQLLALLLDPDPRVRAAAARSLGQLPTLEFSGALEGALADSDANVRGFAARSLGRVGRVQALVPIRRMAGRDPSQGNRRIAREAIEGIERRMASEEEKRRLARFDLSTALLDADRPWEVRARAKACLIRLGDGSLIPVLDRALDATNDSEVHRHVVEVLVTLPPSKDLQNILTRCLHHPSAPVRRRVMRALGDFADKEAIYFLNQVVRDGEDPTHWLNQEDVRLALDAIGRIGERARTTT